MALNIDILKVSKKYVNELSWINVDDYQHGEKLKTKFHRFLHTKEFQYGQELVLETGLAFENVPFELERGVITSSIVLPSFYETYNTDHVILTLKEGIELSEHISIKIRNNFKSKLMESFEENSMIIMISY